ncbi:hypothetical protein MRX96_044385 [Rhipicephalus microplus]
MQAAARRFRFTVETDINMLREVRKRNPYKDTTLWLPVAENLSRTKENLLLDVLQVARKHGYRIRPGAVRKVASGSASICQAPAAASVATDDDSNTGSGEPHLWSKTVFDTVEVITGLPEGTSEVVADSPRSPASKAEVDDNQTSTARTAAEGAVQGAGVSAAESTPRKERAGKRRGSDRHIRFFERRLALEAQHNERVAAQEDRRLDLEERRLALQEQQLQLDRDAHLRRVHESREAHEERRQERAMLQQQNQLLTNVLQLLVEKLQK